VSHAPILVECLFSMTLLFGGGGKGSVRELKMRGAGGGSFERFDDDEEEEADMLDGGAGAGAGAGAGIGASDPYSDRGTGEIGKSSYDEVEVDVVVKDGYEGEEEEGDCGGGREGGAGPRGGMASVAGAGAEESLWAAFTRTTFGNRSLAVAGGVMIASSRPTLSRRTESALLYEHSP